MQTPTHIAAALARYAYRATTEAELQRAIAQALSRAGIPHHREHVVGADRFDVWCAGVVIEAKTQGSTLELLRQIRRYVEHDEVTAVVVATTRRRHLSDLPAELGGKPVLGVHLRGAM